MGVVMHALRVLLMLAQLTCLVQGPSERLSLKTRWMASEEQHPTLTSGLHTHGQTCDMHQHRQTHRVGEEGGRKRHREHGNKEHEANRMLVAWT